MPFARLRTRYLVAMGLAACSRGQPPLDPGDMTSETFVSVPMAVPEPADAGETSTDAAADGHGGTRGAGRPLPAEPMAPVRSNGCVRDKSCRPEEEDAPALAFPAPYERCSATIGKARAASFSVLETREERQNDPHACCYVEFRNCSTMVRPVLGRPLRDANAAPIVAPDASRADWGDAGTFRGDIAMGGLSPPERASHAQHWLAEAALEHASVASFARFALQLMAVGAPADLVRGAHAAALDEIEHARMSFAIAAAYDGKAHGPGALAIDGASAFDPSLVTLAVETLRDGCVSETIAATVARAAARSSRDLALRNALSRIADDEETHAELAWRTLAWAVRTGGEEVVTRLRIEIDQLRHDRSAVMTEVIVPCAEALLS